MLVVELMSPASKMILLLQEILKLVIWVIFRPVTYTNLQLKCVSQKYISFKRLEIYFAFWYYQYLCFLLLRISLEGYDDIYIRRSFIVASASKATATMWYVVTKADKDQWKRHMCSFRKKNKQNVNEDRYHGDRRTISCFVTDYLQIVLLYKLDAKMGKNG